MNVLISEALIMPNPSPECRVPVTPAARDVGVDPHPTEKASRAWLSGRGAIVIGLLSQDGGLSGGPYSDRPTSAKDRRLKRLGGRREGGEELHSGWRVYLLRSKATHGFEVYLGRRNRSYPTTTILAPDRLAAGETRQGS